MDQQEKPTKFLYLPQAKNDHYHHWRGGLTATGMRPYRDRSRSRDLRSPRVSTPARAAGI